MSFGDKSEHMKGKESHYPPARPDVLPWISALLKSGALYIIEIQYHSSPRAHLPFGPELGSKLAAESEKH